MSAFDDDPMNDPDLMIARGRYSTLGSEKRAHLRGLRDDMVVLTTCARTILNAAQEPMTGPPFAPTELAIAEERLRAAKIRLAALAEIEPQMTTLRPLAWPKAKEIHDE